MIATSAFNELSKSESKELLSLATKDLHFIFDGVLHKQIDVVAMDPTLASSFLIYYKKSWQERCPLKYRLFYYRRYLDDTFV